MEETAEKQLIILKKWIREDARRGSFDIARYRELKKESKEAGKGRILKLYLQWYFDRMTGVPGPDKFFDSPQGDTVTRIIEGKDKKWDPSVVFPLIVSGAVVVFVGLLIFLNIYAVRF